MKISTLSISKSKNPSEDVLIALDSRVLGLFDGASTNNTIKVFGQSYGRYAANIAAKSAIEYRDLLDQGVIFEPNDVIKYISSSLNKAYSDGKIDVPYPATTGAMVFIEEYVSHFLVVGDTGVRVNGDLILSNEIVADRIWRELRKYVYGWYLGEFDYPGCLLSDGVLSMYYDCEALSQNILYNGLECAEGGLRDYIKSQIMDNNTIEINGLSAKQVCDIMLQGISGVQHSFANAKENAVGYAIFNGDRVIGENKYLSLPNNEIRHIEIFSDGYLFPPTVVDRCPTIQEWENLYSYIEKTDPFHLSEWPHLKCRLNKDFFDDRSLLIAEYK